MMFANTRLMWFWRSSPENRCYYSENLTKLKKKPINSEIKTIQLQVQLLLHLKSINWLKWIPYKQNDKYCDKIVCFSLKERNRCCSQGDLSGAHSCTALAPEDEQRWTQRPQRLAGAGSSPKTSNWRWRKCWVSLEHSGYMYSGFGWG